MVDSGRLLTGALRTNQKRSLDDWYRTPPEAIDHLLSVLPNDIKDKLGHIWENACGDGVLVDKLQEYGYDVYGSDLIDRANGRFDIIDFLKDDHSGKYFDTILTNPPFKYIAKWIDRSLEHANQVIILSKLQLLESQERYRRFKGKTGYKYWSLKALFPYSKRLTLWRSHIDPSKRGSSGTIPYAWFVFVNNSNENKTHIDWIDQDLT